MEPQKQQLWISVFVLPPALAPLRSSSSSSSNWVQIILWKANALGPAAWPGPRASCVLIFTQRASGRLNEPGGAAERRGAASWRGFKHGRQRL